MNSIKKAQTKYPVLELIKDRWSARSFSSKSISTEDLHTLAEAASWAPSANNEQPWQYILAPKGTDKFERIFEALMEGNRPWCKNAAAFILSIARTHFEKNEKSNFYADHDLGMANALLLLQATSMQIFAHPMAGFEKPKIIESFGLTDLQKPMVVIALGYLDDAEKLEEPYKTRELTARNRKELHEFLI